MEHHFTQFAEDNRMWNAPIRYFVNFIQNPNQVAETLWTELDWQRRDTTPRSEYYWNKHGVPYAYGSGGFSRSYESQPLHPIIETINKQLAELVGFEFDVCFLNGYLDQKDHLGYHADDSPEMDDDKPIAIVSLGAEREIWFRDNNWQTMSKNHTDHVLLQNGSLCLMLPGMQDTHMHRIPKAGRALGRRISLTFRGYKA